MYLNSHLTIEELNKPGTVKVGAPLKAQNYVRDVASISEHGNAKLFSKSIAKFQIEEKKE